MSAALKAGKSCPEALYRSFLESDEEFLNSPSGNTSGSTANVMLYDPTSGYACLPIHPTILVALRLVSTLTCPHPVWLYTPLLHTNTMLTNHIPVCC